MRKQTISLLCWFLLACPLSTEGQRSLSTATERHAQTRPGGAEGEIAKDVVSPQVDPAVKRWSKFLEARRRETHFAWAPAGDHETAGLYTEGGGAYLGASATHAVFKQGDFNLELPSNSAGPQTLFAPTTRPPNGSCLEMGTAYTRVIGQPTSVLVYVYDFCESPRQFVFTIPVDDDFMRKYGGASINGVPAYKVRIYSKDQSLSRQTNWYAEILDTNTNHWLTVAIAKGFVRGDYAGWSIFETWYKKGQCSRTLKTITAANIAYRNAISGAWEPIADDMGLLINSLRRGGDCFVDQDASNLASYNVNELPLIQGWQVTGSGH